MSQLTQLAGADGANDALVAVQQPQCHPTSVGQAGEGGRQLGRQFVHGAADAGGLRLDAVGAADKATGGDLIDGRQQFVQPPVLPRCRRHNGHAQVAGQPPVVDEQPAGIQIPSAVDLEVTETQPGLKGDTASGGGTKPATLETGVTIEVPLFIDEGERVRVDTRSGAYVSRA